MDTKPSEGPWTVQERLSGSENHRGFFIRDVSGFVVADVYPRDQDGNEGRANAQRIAAAREMLEALQDLLHACVEPAGLTRDVIEDKAAFTRFIATCEQRVNAAKAKARAVITKATGSAS